MICPTRSPNPHRLFGSFFILFALGASAGCSVNGDGLIHQTRVASETAIVLKRQASGLHLELEPKALALTIGAFQGQYLYPSACPLAAPENHPPELTYRRTVGAYFRFGAEGIDVSFGLREATILRAPPVGSSYGRRLTFVPAAPGQNRLELFHPITCKDDQNRNA